MAELAREELNREAGLILERAQRLAVTRGRAAYGAAGPADVVAELRADCRALRSDVEQLKREYARLPAPAAGSRDEAGMYTANLLLEEVRLQSELAVIQRWKRIEGVTTQDAVLQSLAYQQVCESCVEQEQLLTALRSEREKVEAELKREQALLKESRELETALEKKLTETRGNFNHQNPNSAEEQLRERISLAEESLKSLRENLIQFCMDEIIQPTDEVEGRGGEGGGGKKKRGGGQERVDTMLLRGSGRQNSEDSFPSLPDVVQELISKTLSSPHAPYLSLSSIWPPHGNLLLRSGVIQRHPDNPTLVRIASFHL